MPYPESSWLHSLFGNAPAVATGIAAALKAKGREDVRVLGQGGDGGTVDIGWVFERNDDGLYVGCDNEGCMNTGVQRSSATPPAARTATTEAVGTHPGNVFGQGKSAPLIALEIPYVATATIGDLHELEAKVVRATGMHGARHLHVLVACPLGWGAAACDSVAIARLATQSGLFPAFEGARGDVTAVTRIRRRVPVEAYLKPQRRFRHLFEPEPPRQPDRLLAHRASGLRPQHRAVLLGLPGGEDPQAWLYHAEEGDCEAAWRAIMGRVGYHPCETACNRAQLDDAVGINGIERFLGDLAIRSGWTVGVDKGCGLCMRECPCGAIEMRPEPI